MNRKSVEIKIFSFGTPSILAAMSAKARKLFVKKLKPRAKNRVCQTFSNAQAFVPGRMPVFHLWLFALLLFTSCQTAPTNLRTFAPAGSIAYLEANDLGKTLNALTESGNFQKIAAIKTDFSVLEDVQMAIVVTGFETSEKQVTAEDAVLNFKPQFVAVADAHTWEWQTISLAENQLNSFVKGIYGDDTKLLNEDKDGGRWFVWMAKDGREVFAFVENSLIFFGNNREAIEKCLKVKSGASESLLKNENLTRAYSKNEENLTFGFVTSEGVKQIANYIGVSTALSATDEVAGRSFIASVLPQILQNTTEEIVWTSQKSGGGIEDNYEIFLKKETASVLAETLSAAAQTETNSSEFLPADVSSATKYNLENPLIAWRSLLLVTAKNTDQMSGKILVQFSNSLLESYVVKDAETFLSAVGSDILTARFDADGEKSAAIVTVKDLESVKKSLIDEINFKTPPEKIGNAEIWKSEEDEISAAFVENKLILGDSESVLKCLEAKRTGQNFTKNQIYKNFAASKAVAVTFAKDAESAEKIANVLGKAKENANFSMNYLTETSFTNNKIERKTVSAFGLIGTILEQLGE